MSELLVLEENSQTARKLHDASLRLYREVAIQSCLTKQEACSYTPIYYEIPIVRVLNELVSSFDHHPAAKNKKIILLKGAPELNIKTDISLLLRILCNMVTNALEATGENGEIRISATQKGKSVIFQVWNKTAIPENVKLRVFQRNFSTKNGAGRGIGTFSMKLFREKILRGEIDFSSSEEEGTTFSFSLPI